MPANIIVKFLKWYFVFVPKYLISFYFKLIHYLDNKLAVTLMVTYLFTPLYGDHTIVGRTLGFIFRSIRIVIGIITILVFTINFYIILVFWYIFPVIYSIFGIGHFLFFLILAFSFFIIKRMYLPTEHAHNINNVMDIAYSFTPRTRFILKSANGKTGDKEYFLKKLLDTNQVKKILTRLELTEDKFFGIAIRSLELDINTLYKEIYSYREKVHFITPSMLFLGLVKSSTGLQSELLKQNITVIDVEDVVFWLLQDEEVLRPGLIWSLDYKVKNMGGVNRAWLAKPTPKLDSVSVDITRKVMEGDFVPLFGKKEIINDIEESLSKEGRKNVLVIGKPGIGKSTVVDAVVQEIVSGNKLKKLRFKRIVKLDSSRLISLSNNASAELIEIIDEILADQNTILFLDDIHLLAGKVDIGKGQQTIFSIFEKYLEEGRFQVIGTTSPKEFKENISLFPSFVRLFDKFELEEPSNEEVLKILEYFIINSKVSYSVQALKDIINLSKKLVRDRVLPDKAIQMIEILNSKDQDGVVYSDEVRKYITETTGVPVDKIGVDEGQKLIHLENKLNEEIIGQPEAVKAISDAVIRARVGTKPENKVIASFMFAGPTGVGKTHTAKVLSKELFGKEEVMIRFDMSEFQNLDDTNVFIDRLSDSIIKNPYSVLLLDELEKANSKLILILLQVLDDARLTNTHGEVIDFSESLIIATTNVGTKVIDELSGLNKSYEEVAQAAKVEINNHFAPEFLNRFSKIIVFASLDKLEVLKVVRLEVEKLAQRTKESKKINLKWSERFEHYITSRAYNKLYGARPISRFLAEEVETYIAKLILENGLSIGEEFDLDLIIKNS